MGMVRVGDVMEKKVVENGRKIHWNNELKATLQKGVGGWVGGGGGGGVLGFFLASIWLKYI